MLELPLSMSRYGQAFGVLILGLVFAPVDRARAAADTVEVCGHTVQLNATSVSCSGYAAWGDSLRKLRALHRLEKLTLIGGRLSAVPSDVANRIRALTVHVPPSTRRWKAPRLASLESIEISASRASLDLSELSNIGPLRDVRVVGGTVDGLERLVQIQKLDLSSTRLVRPDAVNRLSGLETLRLTKVVNLDVITGHPKLRHLHVVACDPEIIDHVGKLPQLRTLLIHGVDEVPSLAELVHLSSLDLYSNKNLRAVPGLAKLRGLVNLNLRDTRFDETAALARLGALEKLDLGMTPVSDIRAIAGLHRLSELNLGGTEVSSLRPLRRLRRLRTLRIITNKATRLDLANLAHMTDLETLDLGGINARSWRPLSRLTGLRHLGIIASNFTDTRVLRRMTGLETLSLTSNQKLSRVRGLERLVKLHTIDLDGTGVSDLTPLAKLPSLRSVGADTAPLRKQHGSCASFQLGQAWVTVEECGGC